jgi:nucleotide-binding universal stress UspA family protein
MFRQVVVGVDEHEGGRDALALAMKLLAGDGELTIAYVHVSNPHVYRAASERAATSERRRAFELLENVRAEAGADAQLRWRASPSVGRGLHELAEIIAADLLVLGSSRRSLLGRVFVGDDTRAALNGAPCAIAIAPAGYAGERAVMREIGVGYDGSPESEHALAVARHLAAECGAKLSAFEAVSLPTYAFLGGPAPIDGAPGSLVDQARERIAGLGGIEAHAAYGVPVEELAVYSASLDLLVVGSRGYGPIGRLIHGSTSQQLARSARCPLLALTRTARPIEPPEAAGNSRRADPALRR